jgi:hypothetical protein
VDREAQSACVFERSAAPAVQCMHMLTEVEEVSTSMQQIVEVICMQFC